MLLWCFTALYLVYCFLHCQATDFCLFQFCETKLFLWPWSFSSFLPILLLVFLLIILGYWVLFFLLVRKWSIFSALWSWLSSSEKRVGSTGVCRWCFCERGMEEKLIVDITMFLDFFLHLDHLESLFFNCMMYVFAIWLTVQFWNAQLGLQKILRTAVWC